MTVIRFPDRRPAPRMEFQRVSGFEFVKCLLSGLAKAGGAAVALVVAVAVVVSVIMGGN